jgi:hypothetical protein
MAHKTTLTTKPNLSSWFFKEPAKLALLSFGLMAGIALLYALVARMITSANTFLNPRIILVAAPVSLIFLIYKYIKWLPKENLDRKSFVAIDNGLTFIHCIFLLLSTILVTSGTQKILFYAMWLQHYSVFWFIFVSVSILLIYTYVFGLLIGSMYATYRRALAMGVPRYKVLLSLPFTITLFWFPGYLLKDDSREKPVVPIKSKWYSKLTDWVVAKPVNAILVFLLTLALSALPLDTYIPLFTLFFAVIFGIWLLITGVKKFRQNIGGAYSTFASTLNVTLIVLCVCAAVFFYTRPQPQISSMQDEEIQITEVSGNTPAQPAEATR